MSVPTQIPPPPPDEKKPQSRFSPTGGDSENNTLAEPQHEENLAGLPDVNWERAAELKPSRLRGKKLTMMVTIVAGTGFTMFGYDQGVLSALLTLPSFLETFPETAEGFYDPQAAALQSFMVAVYQIGCIVGALMNLRLGDWLGRKKTIYIGGIGIIACTVIQTAAVNYDMMCVGRVLCGIFNGLLTSTVPAYQGECAKPHQRGPLVILSGSLIGFGIMTSYWVGLGCYYAEGDVQWRLPIAMQAVFTIAMIACMITFNIPESPRWLAGQGRHEESLAVLAALDDKSVRDPEVVKVWRGILDSIALSEGNFRLRELLEHGKKQHFRRTAIGFLAQMFQQIAGCNLITYYLTSVLDTMGIGPELSRIIAGVNGTVYFLTSLIAIVIIERVGRRPLMLWTTIGMGLTFVLLAGLYIETDNGNSAAQAVSVLCLFIYNCFFTVGWLGMSWLYPAEISPLRIRAPANAISTASNWLFNFFVVMVTGPMFANIGWGTYAFFAACNIIIIFPTVYFLFPETKQFSLEDLDMMFAIANEQNISPFKVGKNRSQIPSAGTPEYEAIMGRIGAERPETGEKRYGGNPEA